MRTLIDLTPVLEEDMCANHLYHPRGPVFLPNQFYEMTRHWQTVTWSQGHPPPTYDGVPEDWANPETTRGMRSEEVLISTHLGTHIDSAQHYNPESQQDAASIPLESCFGSAVVLDFRHLGEEPFEITVEDLDEAEARAGVKVELGEIVILHTGWMAKWGVGPTADRARYSSNPQPGLHHEAPPWFIEREVQVVGGDIANIDYDMTSSAHINFLCREAAGKEPIQIIENLAYLERIPVPRFLFVGFRCRSATAPVLPSVP